VVGLRRAVCRSLVPPETAQELDVDLEQLAKEINQALNYQKTRKTKPDTNCPSNDPTT
jgi:hypothetical protein